MKNVKLCLLYSIFIIFSLALLVFGLYKNSSNITSDNETFKTEVVENKKVQQKEVTSTSSLNKTIQVKEKYVLEDLKGNLLINDEYDQIIRMGKDRVKVKKNGKYGIIDYTGKIII